MKKLMALIGARNKEFYRDRGTLGWTLLFPFIVIVGFAYGYSGRQDPVLRVYAVPSRTMDLPAFKTFQKIPGLQVVGVDDESHALKKLERYEADLVLSLSGTRVAYSLNQDSDKGRLAEHLLIDTMAQQSVPKLELQSHPLTGRHVRYAEWVLPGLLGMNIMFGSMFGVGYVIVRYRKNGVLKRLRATPLSAFQFLVAQIFSRLLLMVMTSLMVVLGAMVLIGFKLQGTWLDLTLFLSLSSSAMIALGLIVAARMSSEEVAEGVLNLMTWPMIFLSGIWFSIEGASRWVMYGAKGMPLTHVVSGLRAIMIDGVSISQLIPEISILLGMSALFLLVGSSIFRWR